MERSELLDVKRPLGKASENFGYGFVPSADSTPGMKLGSRLY